MNITQFIGTLFITLFLLYAIVGTSGDVEEILAKAPAAMEARDWTILSYDGFQYGRFDKHGGTAWYHVSSNSNPHVVYTVEIAIWNGELQYYYDEPEKLLRITSETAILNTN